MFALKASLPLKIFAQRHETNDERTLDDPEYTYTGQNSPLAVLSRPPHHEYYNIKPLPTFFSFLFVNKSFFVTNVWQTIEWKIDM